MGDIGRPDLLEEAAGIMGTREIGAKLQFKNIQKFKDMPDYLQIWPAHGAGSACGKALGAIPSTTLGYEKLFNPAFQYDDETEFMDWLLDGQPEAPYYFARMKHVNKVGPELLQAVTEPQKLDRAGIDAALADGALVLDMRSSEDFAAAHIPGTVNIPENDGGCVNYVGWFVKYDAPVYLIAEADKVESIIRNNQAIGVDNIVGYSTPEIIDGETEALSMIDSQTLADRLRDGEILVIDVRGKTEYQDKHIVGARHIPLGYLHKHIAELPKDTTIVTQCASGYRSQVASSLLQRYGFKNVMNLSDGIDAWSQVLATEEG